MFKKSVLISTGVVVYLLLVSLVFSKTISVMSWNVKNYNLTNRMVDGRYMIEYPKPEKAKEALREVISNAQPDILLFQEIGGDPFLQELANDLEASHGIKYPYWGSVESVDKVRKLGYLSRIPVEISAPEAVFSGTYKYFDERLKVKRGILELTVQGDSETFRLVTFHLKSRFTSNQKDPGSSKRRSKEARLIRDYIRDELEKAPDANFVMVGDMNDHAGSGPYHRFTHISNRPLLREQALADESGLVWTYFYAKKRVYEQIDFLFASSHVHANKLLVNPTIISDPGVFIASDHRPVYFEIKL